MEQQQCLLGLGLWGLWFESNVYCRSGLVLCMNLCCMQGATGPLLHLAVAGMCCRGYVLTLNCLPCCSSPSRLCARRLTMLHQYPVLVRSEGWCWGRHRQAPHTPCLHPVFVRLEWPCAGDTGFVMRSLSHLGAYLFERLLSVTCTFRRPCSSSASPGLSARPRRQVGRSGRADLYMLVQ